MWEAHRDGDCLRTSEAAAAANKEPWREFIPAARAAIAEMRTPTEAMVEVSCSKHKAGEKDQYDRECSRIVRNRSIYGKMIDQALSPDFIVPPV